jgi:tetratricopeptide (TPR) repeat protein
MRSPRLPARTRRTRPLVIGLILLVVIAAVVVMRRSGRPGATPTSPSPVASATYVGSQACAACHPAESQKWRASQHAAAMTIVSEASVLGDFRDRRVTFAGTTSTFFRRNGRFYVRTDGPDGRLDDFAIAYTFGVAPLQQYLIEQPGGRLQALSIAWDTRPASAGGQRWFHLYPHETIKAGDALHWTGLLQNWNFMCADCHATNLRKRYDARAREFHTSWSEIGVGCEACHGPGSVHVAGAREKKWEGSSYGLTARLDERKGISWNMDLSTGVATRSRTRPGDREIEVCARCHARRSQLTDDTHAGDPLENAFRPNALDTALFHADGQQKDEVYNYASFLQSRMYAKGVTCSDCHDPHSGGRPLPGNATCTQCHLAAKYDAPAHHFHRPDTAAALCVTCHMATTTYMVVDPRHDHSFRVPRPDRTVSIGVPNACTTACHRKEGPAWAAREIQRRISRVPGGFQSFAEAFAAADRGAREAPAELRQIAADRAQPAIVRASALDRLSAVSNDLPELTALLSDPSPLVRRSAVAALAHADPPMRVRFVPALLTDPIRAVRIQAAIALAEIADRSLTADDRAKFERAFDEFVAEQRFNADRPEAQANLGQLLMQRGRAEEAIGAFREAIHLDRTFFPAYANLADAYRLQGNEAEAERVLREGIASSPASAVLRHSLGLALVRQHRLRDALPELARAVTLDPAEPRYSYVYAVGLHENGQRAAAIRVLQASAARHPNDQDTRQALAEYLDEGRRPER